MNGERQLILIIRTWWLYTDKFKEIKNHMMLSLKKGYLGLSLITLSLVSFCVGNTHNDYTWAQVTNKQPDKVRQFMQELKLTDEQQKQITAIRNKYKNSIEQRREALKAAQEQLEKLMAGDASVYQIHAKHSELQSIWEELEKLRFNSMLEIRDVLTINQRAQMAEIMAKYRQKFRQMVNHPPGF